MGGGAMAAFGVLTALFDRIRTGKGQVYFNFVCKLIDLLFKRLLIIQWLNQVFIWVLIF